MSPSVLDYAPPRPVKIETPVSPSLPPRRPRDSRWILPIGLAVSVVVHGLLLLVIRFSVTLEYGPPPPPRAVPAPEGTRIVQIVPVPDAVAPVSAPVQEQPVVTLPPARQPDAVTVPTPVTESRPTDVGSISDRIRPDEVDPLLWTRPPEPLPPVPDDATLARNRLYARLGVWNDSMLIAAGAAAAATDWTTTDANGNRWGVSPGKLHLGSLTLPLPINFGPPPGRRDELRNRVRTWDEINKQAGRVDVKNGFNDRVRAIRERNQAKRDSTKSGGGG